MVAWVIDDLAKRDRPHPPSVYYDVDGNKVRDPRENQIRKAEKWVNKYGNTFVGDDDDDERFPGYQHTLNGAHYKKQLWRRSLP